MKPDTSAVYKAFSFLNGCYKLPVFLNSVSVKCYFQSVAANNVQEKIKEVGDYKLRKHPQRLFSLLSNKRELFTA